MADNKAPQAAPQAAPALTDAERAELEELRAQHDAQEAAAPAPTEDMDETIPGGAYRVGDQLVNANGEPIDSKGNVKKG